MAIEDADDNFLTRREADILIRQAEHSAAERFDTHQRAHDAAHKAHDEKHISTEKGIGTALDAVDRERRIHAEAHTKEHDGHQREHAQNNQAIDKAEAANDKRFAGANAFRETFEARIQASATKDAVESLRQEFDRRTTVLERNDVKAEGRGLGQGALVAYILSGVGFLGSMIVLANFFTAR
ncbi:MAG: hypothetical protein H0U13_04585 [Gemmatimonadaceae bacterium]|nr:hypothetical protein [Gemmatimonadaceae bacterium]